MKYIALLRGINVGGNNMIKMSDLKKAFEDAGYANVRTYINSGNVIFETEEENNTTLAKKIEAMITKTFIYEARVIIQSESQLKKIVASVPKEWKTSKDIRCYIAFLKDPLTPEEAVKEIDVREGVDTLATGPGVLYMTSLLKKLSKSAFNKLAGKKIYKEMTIRNYNTTRKLLSLLEDKE